MWRQGTESGTDATGNRSLPDDPAGAKRHAVGIQTHPDDHFATSAAVMIEGIGLDRPPGNDDLMDAELPPLHGDFHRHILAELYRNPPPLLIIPQASTGYGCSKQVATG